MVRRALTILLVLLLAAAGYAVADARDLVPGVLTADEDPSATAGPRPGAETAVLTPVGADAPVPTTDGLTRALRTDLSDPALGAKAGVLVRDALTGEVLLERSASKAIAPASTQKVLSAAAIASRADLAEPLTTRVVRSAPDELTLVAGGDTMLAKGAGDPARVEGRAGLGDLAQQVADHLKDQAGAGGGEASPLRLRLDASRDRGPRYPSTWDKADVAAGYTQAVTTIGLAGQRPEPGRPSPQFPEREALAALATQLTERGVDVTVDDDRARWGDAAPADAEELGSVASAPLGQVLALALDTSDNALTESLTRRAAVADGARSDARSVADWVLQTLADEGVDTQGATLLDTSGLSRGQAVSARLLSDAMQLGLAADGDAPALREVLVQLPVAGVSGTLAHRFHEEGATAAAGIARAKTGTLTGVSSLAGTTVTADGRLLSYVILSDDVPSSTGTLGARAVLDQLVAQITACGCR